MANSDYLSHISIESLLFYDISICFERVWRGIQERLLGVGCWVLGYY